MLLAIFLNSLLAVFFNSLLAVELIKFLKFSLKKNEVCLNEN
jgi:hypothetical protein